MAKRVEVQVGEQVRRVAKGVESPLDRWRLRKGEPPVQKPTPEELQKPPVKGIYVKGELISTAPPDDPYEAKRILDMTIKPGLADVSDRLDGMKGMPDKDTRASLVAEKERLRLVKDAYANVFTEWCSGNTPDVYRKYINQNPELNNLAVFVEACTELGKDYWNTASELQKENLYKAKDRIRDLVMEIRRSRGEWIS